MEGGADLHDPGYTHMMVTMREVDYEGRMELIPCKVEERKPAIF